MDVVFQGARPQAFDRHIAFRLEKVFMCLAACGSLSRVVKSRKTRVRASEYTARSSALCSTWPSIILKATDRMPVPGAPGTPQVTCLDSRDMG
jgi:hypothetical protein